MSYPRKFEKIDDYSSRLKVPGGWVVRTDLQINGMVHTIFISDPNHEWVLEKQC